MARYTVHVRERPDAHAEALERAVFVRDGWSWGAFSFGPFWLIWNRHWITGLLMLVVHGAGLIAVAALPIQEAARFAAMLLLALLWALEGSSLRRLALKWSGHTEAGLVVGDDLDTLERRFFAEMGPERTVPPTLAVASPATTSVDRSYPSGGVMPMSQPVIGLFPDSRKPT